MRIRKTLNDTATEYPLHGKLVVHIKKGSDNHYFFYDVENRSIMITHNGLFYGLVHNLQCDTTIFDAAGAIVVEYSYDA